MSIDFARRYIGRGWTPVPIPPREKGPRIHDWPNLRITEDSVPQYFNEGCNIGVILGRASGGLTDLDLDCAEAIEFALKFPLATDAIFGRKSKPHSHRLYYVKGTAPTMRFLDPVRGDTLFELRGDGGFQTVFPGSTHPSGEQIEWEADGVPATVDAALLCKHAKWLAASCLIKRYCSGVADYESIFPALAKVDIRVANKVREWLGITPTNPVNRFSGGAESQAAERVPLLPVSRSSVSEKLRRSLAETAWSPAAEARVRSALRVIPAVSRDIWLRVGMALHTAGWVNAFQIWDDWARTCPEKYDEADQRRAWKSFSRRRRVGAPITLGTIFHLATEYGWSDDRVADANSAQPQDGQQDNSPNDLKEHAAAGQRELMMSAAKLRTKRFDAVRYVLPGFVPEGLTMLAGRPKIGKSWWALDFAVACAAGRTTLGTLTPISGDVLYLALEDGWRRLQGRLDKLLGTFHDDWPERLNLVRMGGWRRSDEGGLEDIEAWCKSVPNPTLIVIDTLQRFRKPTSGKSPLYGDDYEANTGLQKIASDHKVAILILHHDRKSDADDAFDTVSGTLGLTAAPDTILIIKRKANCVVLYARGRDIEESETALQFTKETCRWTILGKAAEVQRSTERGRVIAALKAAGQSLSVQQIMMEAEMSNRNAVDILLGKMAKDGEIVRVARGRYNLSGKGNGQIGQKERKDNQVSDFFGKNVNLSNLSDLSGRTE
jgi:hypothetical protein